MSEYRLCSEALSTEGSAERKRKRKRKSERKERDSQAFSSGQFTGVSSSSLFRRFHNGGDKQRQRHGDAIALRRSCQATRPSRSPPSDVSTERKKREKSRAVNIAFEISRVPLPFIATSSLSSSFSPAIIRRALCLHLEVQRPCVYGRSRQRALPDAHWNL